MTAADEVSAAISTPTPPAKVATSLASGVPSWFGLAPVATDQPVAPVQAFLWSVLAWVGRELDRWTGHLPVADPRQVAATDTTGVVLGTLDVADEARDQLAYHVIQQPQRGQVVVNPDGTYVYTPNDDVPGTVRFEGYKDTFSVQVETKGFTFGNLLARITGMQPGISVPITVNVPPQPGGGGIPTQTLGFDVLNASSKPVYLSLYGDHLQNQVTQSPPIGSILQPGEAAHYEVVYYFLGLGQVNPTYVSQDGKTQWKVYMSVDGFRTRGAKCTSSGGACSPSSFSGSSQVVLMDNPGGVITIPSGKGQAQADVLNKVCGGGSAATCSFVARGTPLKTYSKPKEIAILGNGGTQPVLREISEKVANTNTYSVEVSAKAGITIKTVVEAEISAKYGRSWVDNYETTVTDKYTVPAGKTLTVYAQSPVVRYTGDFTVKMGNTTWNLKDVYIDQPEPPNGLRAVRTFTKEEQYVPTVSTV
jgi:hypothetical protein